MKASEILHAVGDLLEQPGAWTQGAFARDIDGHVVRSCDADAVCWCAFGAFGPVSPNGLNSLYEEAGTFLREAIGRRSITQWNDDPNQTQENVVETFRKAEDLAKAAGA